MFYIFSPKTVSRCLIISVALFSASPVLAETTLTAIDGTMTISGELLGLDDDGYRIQTATGELLIRREFVTCTGEGCPVVEAVDQNDSGEISLTSSDGRIAISGKLIDVTNTEYVVDTAAGPLTVRREFVTCEGESCPGSAVGGDSFMVSVSGADGADLVSAIVGDYTAAKDFNLTQQLGGAGTLPTLLVGDKRGLEISRINIQQMNTAEAISSLFDGQSQFAITTDQIFPELLSTQLNEPVDNIEDYLNEEIIALDAISFVVASSTGIDVISLDDARAVMDGRIANWAELGGADEPITLHLMADNERLVEQLRERDMIYADSFSNATLYTSADALNAAINENSSAFGVMYRSQTSGVKALNLVSACNIFVDNSDFSIQTEEYPLTLRWYQYSLNEAVVSEFARNVSRFIPTDSGQQAIASRGMVTQQLQIVPMQDQGARMLSTVLASGSNRASTRVMREYFRQAANARRISTSMRFLSGNSILDSKAESDIDRVSEIIRSNEYEGYEVVVFGFSDSIGEIDYNLILSKRRADSVRDILLQKNSGYLESDTVRSIGIGPVAPVGCNQFVQGREQNRRVEIWLRPRA